MAIKMRNRLSVQSIRIKTYARQCMSITMQDLFTEKAGISRETTAKEYEGKANSRNEDRWTAAPSQTGSSASMGRKEKQGTG